jgi:O-acetyl-ADP-ribose deacetylase (regulator of RNase III)
MTSQPKNVKHIVGDLFSSELPALGQGVNIDGLMGAGVAKLFRQRFPRMYQDYKYACQHRELDAGALHTFREDGTWVLNLASQDRPGANARIDWLASSLVDAFEFAQERSLQGFALPRIGAGIGGLTHGEAVEAMHSAAAAYPNIELEVYALAPDEWAHA